MKELFPRKGAERAGVSLSNRPDDEQLREQARALLECGALPRRRPDRIWGGPGGGGECPVCGAAVTADEVEMELEYAGEDASMPAFVHVHLDCFAALERASRQLSLTGSTREINGIAKRRQPARSGRANGSPFPDGS